MSKNSTMTIGMDLGTRRTEIVALDDEGKVSWRKRVKTDASEIREALSLPRCRVVMEVGTQSPWVSRIAIEMGHEVIVANARRVKLISASRRKSDRVDAELLARLGRVDPQLLSPIQHRSEAAQVDLSRVRTRAALVRSRSLQISCVRGQVKSFGSRLAQCSAESFYKLEDDIPDPLKPALRPAMRQIRSLTVEIKKLDRDIQRLCQKKYPVALRFQQIAGVGPVTALCFALTIDDPSRIYTSRDIGAFLGLTPGRRQTGDSDQVLRITKEGDSYLRQLLVECAHYIMTRGPECNLREFGLKLFNRGGKYPMQRAAVAVARKLGILLHRLWMTGDSYDPHYKGSRRKNVKVYELRPAA